MEVGGIHRIIYRFKIEIAIFLRFSFLLQLITPKFPVVVKVGHANGGYGKVSLFLKRNVIKIHQC